MKIMRAFWIRLRGLFGLGRQDGELDAELSSHLQLHIDDNLRAGMSPEEARRQALIQLGGVEQTRQAYREQQSLPWAETLWQDIRFGLRMLRKSPGFSAIAVFTLALGIGANTAIFSIVNGVLLNPLPFPHADRLVILHESKPNFERGSISYPNFKDWRDNNHTFSSMATSRGYSFALTGMGAAEQVDGQFITSGVFETLGVRPLMGRTFKRDEEQPGATPVALISEGLWRRKFSASPDVLGKAIILEGRSFTIIGVIPASFQIAAASLHSAEAYVPMGQWRNTFLDDRASGMGMRAIARLKPGVTLEQANADMAQVTRNLAVAYPEADKGIGATLVPLKEQMVGDVRPFLLVLLAAVAFVLLIACVNVASLMLARSTGRMREFAVRIALGASRKRIVRQLITESLLLSGVAGCLGLLLAVWGTHAGLKLVPDRLPRSQEIGLDLRVLIFTTAISLAAGTLFGLVPALKTSQADPHSALKEGGRGGSGTRHRAQSVFVIAEMAMALVLLIGAGLMLGSLTRLWRVDPGFNAQNILIFGYTLPPSMIDGNPAAIREAYRNLDSKLAAAPGIRAVSQVWGSFPLDEDDEEPFWLYDQAKPANTNAMSSTLNYIVGTDYLKVLETSLRRGRFLTAQDDEHVPPVGVIDDVFAHQYFPGQDPIGKRIMLNNPDRSVEIVGVVGHVKQWGLDSDNSSTLRAQLYTSWQQAPDDFTRVAPGGISAAVRYTGDVANATAAVRKAVGQMGNEQIVYYSYTMQSVIAHSFAQRRFVMIVLGVFAALALLLASVGIYGVIAYVAGQRTQEIGIRMALGAQRADVLRMMLWQGTRLALIGVAIGIAAALGLTRLMAKMLYGVSATDPLTYSGVAIVLMLVAVAACYLPARRATRVDPMRALRTE
jgi:predicted permease